MTSRERSVAEKINEHRDDLEAIADSDFRCAKHAQTLLDLADEHGGGSA
ncbi:hypothetical protein [Halobaculum rarum]